MLLAACGGAGPAPRPSPPPPTAYAGRVGIAGQSWTDFVIDGTDAAARELCDVLVASEQRTLSRVATGTVDTTPCALQALTAAATTGPYLLVDRVSVTEHSAEIERLLQGRHEPLAAAHGTRTTRVPVVDRATCEAMKKHLDADDAAARNAVITTTAEFLAQELDRAKQREREACDRVHADEQSCANLPPDATAACQHGFEDERAACETARQQREIVEQKQHAPVPAAPAATRSCEPAH